MSAQSVEAFGGLNHQGHAEPGPKVTAEAWGYSLRACAGGEAAGVVGALGGRFLGAALLVLSLGLWFMPDAPLGNDVLLLKAFASVLLAGVGVWLIRAGRSELRRVFQIDLQQSELRIGMEDVRGNVQLRARLPFDEISAIYLQRSKDHSQPTRLFLRLGAGHEPLPIASGAEAPLEALRDRLTRDLTHPAAARPMRALPSVA